MMADFPPCCGIVESSLVEIVLRRRFTALIEVLTRPVMVQLIAQTSVQTFVQTVALYDTVSAIQNP